MSLSGIYEKMNQNIQKLDLLSDISQLVSLFLLLKDASNTDLMKELQHQNNDYLEKIVQDLEKIKEKLKKNEEKIT